MQQASLGPKRITFKSIYKINPKFQHKKEFNEWVKNIQSKWGQREDQIIQQGCHGTASKHVNSITKDGFLTKRNRNSVGGKGSYCATDAKEVIPYCLRAKGGGGLLMAFAVKYTLGKLSKATNKHSIDNLPEEETTCFGCWNDTYRCVPVDHGMIPTHLIVFEANNN